MLRQRFVNEDGIINRQAVAEFFQRIRVLYDNAVPPYLSYRRAGFFRGNKHIIHLLCLARSKKVPFNMRFKRVTPEIMLLIVKQIVDIDMRAAGLMPR